MSLEHLTKALAPSVLGVYGKLPFAKQPQKQPAKNRKQQQQQQQQENGHSGQQQQPQTENPDWPPACQDNLENPLILLSPTEQETLTAYVRHHHGLNSVSLISGQAYALHWNAQTHQAEVFDLSQHHGKHQALFSLGVDELALLNLTPQHATGMMANCQA